MINFRINEGDDGYLEDIYEEFKDDFLNPYTTIKDLMVKFNISFNKYEKLRLRVCRECNLKQKPIRRSDAKILNRNTYIHKRGNKFEISKTSNRKTVYYGLYESIDDAVFVRGRLIECNWDKSMLKSIKKELIDKKCNGVLN